MRPKCEQRTSFQNGGTPTSLQKQRTSRKKVEGQSPCCTSWERSTFTLCCLLLTSFWRLPRRRRAKSTETCCLFSWSWMRETASHRLRSSSKVRTTKTTRSRVWTSGEKPFMANEEAFPPALFLAFLQFWVFLSVAAWQWLTLSSTIQTLDQPPTPPANPDTNGLRCISLEEPSVVKKRFWQSQYIKLRGHSNIARLLLFSVVNCFTQL